MMDLSDKSVCVVDSGVFQEIARSLSRTFAQVYYTSPWVADYPSSYKTELGEGFPNFERVNDIWEIVDDVDLFVFTDLHQGTLQEYLQAQGKRVFGSRNGDELECDRTTAKAHFAKLGIPQAPYEVVVGMDALRSYIQSRGSDKLWIKINRTRGDTETFGVEGYDLCKNRLDLMEAEYGPIAERREFIVEDNLPETLEIAIDTYCIDGTYPTKAMLGVEQKDQGYVCCVKPWADMPLALRGIYDAISPDLQLYQYRNLFALESLVGANGLWLADPCCRFGSPVSELELDLIANLPEIMWQGAIGTMVEPQYKAKFGCEVLIKSSWSPERPMLIQFPQEYRNQIKLRYAAQFGNETWILPQNSGEEVGAIVAYGNSLEDCMAEVSEIGKQVKGTQLSVTTGSMDDLNESLRDLASWGIEFK